MIDDSYLVPAGPARSELRERGSRFVANVFVIHTPEEADERIEAVRKREYDATHHCSAWRVGPGGSSFRSSDDGEPGGSAGAPILAQIEGRELTDTLVVVTRYYGGTKLGVGGLIRAYGGAASAALDAAGRRTVVIRSRCTIRYAYDDTSAALHCVDRFDAEVVRRLYDEDAGLVLDVRRGESSLFEDAFIEALGGRGRIEWERAG